MRKMSSGLAATLLVMVWVGVCFAGEITIPASQETAKSDTKKKNVDLTGTLVFGHDEAGGYYGLDIPKAKKTLTVVYIFAVEEALQTQIQSLIDTNKKVHVIGTMETWKDGSKAFHDGKPIKITW